MEEAVEEVIHEVEEALNGVREHMILSVRDYSLQLAFILMTVTSVILVIGTVYVWCFHHPNPKLPNKELSASTSIETTEQSSSDSFSNGTSISRQNSGDEINESVKSEQYGQVTRRTSSSSWNNNNDSPVKSKIPVRQKSKSS